MATRLRAIEGRTGVDHFGLVPQGDDGSPQPLDSSLGDSILRRPGDHIETLWLDDPSAVAELRVAAELRRLHPDTGIAIVLERRLAAAEIRQSCGASQVSRLDDLSARETPKAELWAANSAYVRHLLHGAMSLTLNMKTSRRLSVPIRLVDRLSVALPQAFEPGEDELGHAVLWEVASVLRGETLTEWAYRSALARPL